LPVLVDAAGELPPRVNLKRIVASGADLVAFSGGKAIRGPQSTGILCGRRELIASAALQMFDMDDHPELWNPPKSLIDRAQFNGMPRQGIGRSLKVSKEEIVALLTALNLFVTGADEAEEGPRLLGYATRIHEALSQAGVCITRAADSSPVLEIAVNSQSNEVMAFEICRRLRDGDPPVYVGHGKLSEGALVIRTACLRDDQIDPLIRRCKEELVR
jgi:L-seryl-tRNA(Ser) seleniumtransferase